MRAAIPSLGPGLDRGPQNMQTGDYTPHLTTAHSQEKMTADLDATISSVTCPPPAPSLPPLPDLSHLATLQALTGAGCQVFMFQVFSASQ